MDIKAYARRECLSRGISFAVIAEGSLSFSSSLPLYADTRISYGI